MPFRSEVHPSWTTGQLFCSSQCFSTFIAPPVLGFGGEASAASSPSAPPPFSSFSTTPLSPFSSSPLFSVSPLRFVFLFVGTAGGTLAGGLHFSLDLGSLWVSRSVGLRSAVEVLGFRKWCGVGGCNNSGVGVGVAVFFFRFSVFLFLRRVSVVLPVWVSPRSGGCPVWVSPKIRRVVGNNGGFVLVKSGFYCAWFGWVAASGQWSARRGFGAALDCQRLPFRGQNSACQREFSLWSGVLTGEGKSLSFSSRFRRRFGFWITELGKTDFSVLHCSLRLGF
ncbi:hypothetical protein RHGRI_004743 [Rhododendron griersonianum]|uniref:Transmembrane protein n=1 Tax=Rhododendron griersonianum TaxID=479676 RepID=A0AAV6LAI7_9ERIC|nr:hypothetical protein RHGRI_004743 [Rhododendron griersonianum]